MAGLKTISKPVIVRLLDCGLWKERGLSNSSPDCLENIYDRLDSENSNFTF